MAISQLIVEIFQKFLHIWNEDIKTHLLCLFFFWGRVPPPPSFKKKIHIFFPFCLFFLSLKN